MMVIHLSCGHEKTVGDVERVGNPIYCPVCMAWTRLDSITPWAPIDEENGPGQ